MTTYCESVTKIKSKEKTKRVNHTVNYIEGFLKKKKKKKYIEGKICFMKSMGSGFVLITF